jgi:hypothetical protein
MLASLNSYRISNCPRVVLEELRAYNNSHLLIGSGSGEIGAMGSTLHPRDIHAQTRSDVVNNDARL